MSIVKNLKEKDRNPLEIIEGAVDIEAKLEHIQKVQEIVEIEDEIFDISDLNAGPVYFRHDTKLILQAHTHFTKLQVRFK